jgi:hypothetical protein
LLLKNGQLGPQRLFGLIGQGRISLLRFDRSLLSPVLATKRWLPLLPQLRRLKRYCASFALQTEKSSFVDFYRSYIWRLTLS